MTTELELYQENVLEVMKILPEYNVTLTEDASLNQVKKMNMNKTNCDNKNLLDELKGISVLNTAEDATSKLCDYFMVMCVLLIVGSLCVGGLGLAD